MNPLSCGIFWVICADDADGYPALDTFELLTFTVPCDQQGNILDPSVPLNAKSGTTYNHKLTWNQLAPQITQGHSYQYHPRGRVEIRRGKALVFINPVLHTPAVLTEICHAFGLDNALLQKIAVKNDGSTHYHCRFDDPSII